MRNKHWNWRKSSCCKWLHIFRETFESLPWLSHGTIQWCYKISVLLIVSYMYCSCRAWWDCTVRGAWWSWQLLNFKMAVHQYLLDFHQFARCTINSIYSFIATQYDKWPKMQTFCRKTCWIQSFILLLGKQIVIGPSKCL